MASYQDIESRLQQVERRLKFLMTTMRGHIQEPTSMLDQNGRQIVKQRVVTLEEVYLLSNNANIELVPKEEAPAEPEIVNG